MTTTSFQPKYVSQALDISTATVSAARAFNLGGKPVQLGLDIRPRQQMALVNKFDLDATTAKKLGRSENFVECVASSVTARQSRAELDRYLSGLRVPAYLREHAQFYFISARRRKPDDARSATTLSKKHEILAEEHFVLGSVEEAKQLMLMIVPSGRRGVTVVKVGKLLQALEPEPDTGDSSGSGSDSRSSDSDGSMSYPDDPQQDFAVCYQNCLSNVPEWLLATVAGVCAGCVTLIGTVAIGGAVATPILIGVCVGCVVALGAVIGNCILTCHEMFGT